MLGRDADRLAIAGPRRARLGRHVGDLETEGHVGRVAAAAGSVQRMPRRELLPRRVAHDIDRRLQRVGELDEQVPRLRRASEFGDLDQRALSGDEQARRFADRGGFALRRRGEHELRNARLVGDDRLLQLGADRQHHRSHRRRHRDLVGAHRRLRESLERRRLVVVLDEAADQQAHVLRAVRPVDHAGRIAVMANDDHDRDAIGPGLKQRHRRVQQPDGPVNGDQHRLAGGLGVAVRHRDGGLFVQAGQDLGRRVLAVVDEGFVEPLERRSRIDGGVLEADLLQHVHHEVGGRTTLSGNGSCRRGGAALCLRVRKVVACASVGKVTDGATGGAAGGVTASAECSVVTTRPAAPSAAPLKKSRRSRESATEPSS